MNKTKTYLLLSTLFLIPNMAYPQMGHLHSPVDYGSSERHLVFGAEQSSIELFVMAQSSDFHEEFDEFFGIDREESYDDPFGAEPDLPRVSASDCERPQYSWGGFERTKTQQLNRAYRTLCRTYVTQLDLRSIPYCTNAWDEVEATMIDLETVQEDKDLDLSVRISEFSVKALVDFCAGSNILD